jgi:hypothetical protein
MDQRDIEQIKNFNILKWDSYIKSRGLTQRPKFYAGENFDDFKKYLLKTGLPGLSFQELALSFRFMHTPFTVIQENPSENPLLPQQPQQPQPQQPQSQQPQSQQPQQPQSQQQYQQPFQQQYEDPYADPYADFSEGHPFPSQQQYQQPQSQQQYENQYEDFAGGPPPQPQPQPATEEESIPKLQPFTAEDLNILGKYKIPIIENPTPEQIKIIRTAYRKATLGLHPDHGGDTKEFQRLSVAYERVYKDRYKTGFGLTTKHLLRRKRKYIM